MRCDMHGLAAGRLSMVRITRQRPLREAVSYVTIPDQLEKTLGSKLVCRLDNQRCIDAAKCKVGRHSDWRIEYAAASTDPAQR